METGPDIIARYGMLKSKRAPWEWQWQQAANYGLPRKSDIIHKDAPGNTTNPANSLYDVTAVEAIQSLANGHSAYITPPGSRWFAWEAPEEIKSDEADRWFNHASEVAAKILAATNFYTALNEAFLDRSGFGIACMGVFPDPEIGLNFQTHPVASYCIEEDERGNVDTVFRETKLGIRQIVQMFGEEALEGNKQLLASWSRFKTKGINTEHEIIHAVFPRLDRDENAATADQMPIASLWVAVEGKTILLKSGFTEMPYTVTRYLKRSGAGQEYGYGPFNQVRAAVIDANKVRQILQVVGQKMAVPPVLIPDNLVGNVDLRPGGRTIFKSAGAGALPQEWATAGNPQWMLEQLADDRETIYKAFHVDLFRMFSQEDKVMTAREVAERSSEKLMQFSPAFTRFTSDFQVMMEAIFANLLRVGAFGRREEIPEEVIKTDLDGGQSVPPPKVVYQSRIALAIRQAETGAADRVIERAMGAAQLDPSVTDQINFGEYLRISARNDGAPEKMLNTEEQVEEIQKARQQAQQQQQALEVAQQAADIDQKTDGGLSRAIGA